VSVLDGHIRPSNASERFGSLGGSSRHLTPGPASPSAALDAIYEFVPVGVKEHPPLLHEHAGVPL
jgi:hypothetical protein